MILEPLLGVREAAAEVDIDVGRVHEWTGTVAVERRGVGRERQLDVAGREPRVLPAVRMRGQVQSLRRPVTRGGRELDGGLHARLESGIERQEDPIDRDMTDRADEGHDGRAIDDRLAELGFDVEKRHLGGDVERLKGCRVDAAGLDHEGRCDLGEPRESICHVGRPGVSGTSINRTNQIVAFDLIRLSG